MVKIMAVSKREMRRCPDILGLAAGCPARIRTSINGVRVRSLTIRRQGNAGGRQIR
jgi:hypothetical protein